MMARWLPGIGALRTYEIAWLPHDLAAGLVLGAVMVPVGLAFGALAGAPLAGLYAGIFPLVVYALFGSSRQLIVGPDASMAALVAVSVAPLAGGDVAKLTLLAGGLAVMAGLICVLGSLLRLGFMADFLSTPVIVGFMHGLAAVIAVGQLPGILGIQAAGETTLEQLMAVGRNLGNTNPVALAVGAGTFAIILGCRRWFPRIPGQVVALAAALGLVFSLGLDGHGLAVVGHIPTGLPGFQLPTLGAAELRSLLPVAMVAALVLFSDTMVTARGFASRNRYQIDANQEMLAVGLGNIAAGFTQGLPISASGSRTAVAESAGGRTQITSIAAAAVVAAVMLYLTEVLYFLPLAALGGILVGAAWNLCDFREFGRIWRFRGMGLIGTLLTLGGVVGLGVMEGIGLGVLFSLVMVLRELAFPSDATLGRMGRDDFHDLSRHDDAKAIPGLVVYRFSAPLFFANCSFFRNRVERLIEEATEPLHGFIVDGAAINDVNLAACEMLADIRHELNDRGIRMAIANLRSNVRDKMTRGWEAAGTDLGLFFPTIGAAAAEFGSGPDAEEPSQ
jgi:sulfate permease, SulP family